MVIFLDLDGTLFKAKEVMLRAIRRLFADYGVPAPDEESILKTAPQGAVVTLLDMLDARTSDVLIRYKELIRESIIECGELFPGVRETLRQLYSDEHELIVVSNSPEDYIRLALEQTGISGLITRFYSAEPYKSKSELIGILAKGRTSAAVVGDTHGDVEAAHENGLPAVAVTYGYGNKQMLENADVIVKSAEEIPLAVGKL